MNWDYLGVIVLMVTIGLFGVYLKIIRPYLLDRILKRTRREIKNTQSKSE